jgi:diacylglycerol kinase (ATP)
MKTCLLIFNPNSGDNQIQFDELLDRASSELGDFHCVGYDLSKQVDSNQLSTFIQDLNPKLLIIAGGDGTVKLVCKSIIKDKIPVAIIPTGSANGLAKCLGINSVDEAWESIAKMKISSIDAIKVGEELCLHLADFGLNASLVEKFEKEGSRGMAGYAKNYFSEIFNGEQGYFTLEMEGEKIPIEAKMLVIGNGDQYGTGAKINTKGKMNDGLFEVISLNPETLFDYLDGTLAMFQGTLNEKDVHQCWQGTTCRIYNHNRLPFQIDGDVMEPLESVEVELMSKAFNFVVGENFQS